MDATTLVHNGIVYQTSANVIAGCQLEKEIFKLNELCQSGTSTQKEIVQAKAAAQKEAQRKPERHAPPCLTMIVKHDDIVVMHGIELQQIFEVCFNNVFLGTMPGRIPITSW